MLVDLLDLIGTENVDLNTVGTRNLQTSIPINLGNIMKCFVPRVLVHP